MLVLLFAGAVGGLVRGIVGFLKHQFAYKNVEFRPAYIAGMMVLSSLVGLVVTWAIVSSGLEIVALAEINPAVAFIVGYAGGDLIENLYKILVGKATLYPLPKK
jgi:NADH:ubiquinone oxidoreductase subunit 6 (subunit J)